MDRNVVASRAHGHQLAQLAGFGLPALAFVFVLCAGAHSVLDEEVGVAGTAEEPNFQDLLHRLRDIDPEEDDFVNRA